jgi:ubiquinone/menaquinone biosynthesis C-methylase UbiE
MARLMSQDRLLTKNMGGLLARLDDLSTIHDVLDIACGSGGWVLDLAFANPEMDVVGCDVSHRMIDYAQTQAEVQGLSNAHFRVMDALKPLAFPDAAFDLVNARFISTFMSKEAWPLLLQECRRILRPAGTLRITEFERGLSNSPAHERISTLFTQALQRSNRSYSPDGLHVGILPVLAGLFRDAGFEQTRAAMFGVDYSSGAEAHSEWYQDLLVLFRLAQPFIERAGAATSEELERIYQRAMVEMDLPEFRAILPCITVWGCAPPPPVARKAAS